MPCGLCNEPAENVDVTDDAGNQITTPICDDCLINPSAEFEGFIQSKVDLKAWR